MAKEGKAERPSRELVPTAKRAEDLRALLASRKSELAAALPRHITADRMVRLALTACSRNPRLLDCTPASFYGSVLQASQLGLEVDLLGQAYLVPFFNSKKGAYECQMIPGYQGLLALARRSGQILSVEARVVRAGDAFSYSYGLKPVLEHTPKPDALGELTHVYAIARVRDAEPQWLVMTKAECEKHRARSRAATAGPWVTDYEAMCLKTVLRVLCKLLPSSVELQMAIRLDEAAEVGIPQDLPLPDLPPPDEKAAATPDPVQKAEQKALREVKDAIREAEEAMLAKVKAEEPLKPGEMQEAMKAARDAEDAAQKKMWRESEATK